MGLEYRAVSWNRQKRMYDRSLIAGLLIYIGLFIGLGSAVNPNATFETQLIRSFGTGAFLLLHVILCIGPLCRLDARFLPLLYNRRHLGVTMFVMAFVHGGLSLFQFHGLGDENLFVSLFTANMRYDSLAWFPFQPLGFFALVILFLMAATSHDFWLANLGPRFWKSLHMFVYLAYALIVAHVALGVLQAESHPALAAAVGIGMVLVFALHLVAAAKEARVDGDRAGAGGDWIDVGPVQDIPEDRAKVVSLAGERVAVFRYDGKLSAISNICRHQNGPLGEGRVIDGCVTCPWHGYQYRPEDGCAPPPFHEKVETYDVRVVAGRVQVHPEAHAPGTPREPARVEEGSTEAGT